ncbi:MAG: Maf family protein [Burkholderiaceae bacterium]
MTQKILYLASKSPRRIQILKEIGKELGIVVRKLNEKHLKGMGDIEEIKNKETPIKYVTRVAMDKAIFSAEQILKTTEDIKPIICGDTIVCLRDKIFLKPRSRSDVVEMLTQLSNQQHKVITSIVLSIPNPNQDNSFIFHQINSTTSVWFSEIPRSWIIEYSKTDEPMDKSGSYGIQGRASIFIKKISGSYSSVVGLPIYQTYLLLSKYLC